MNETNLNHKPAVHRLTDLCGAGSLLTRPRLETELEEAERVHELKVTERKHARQGWAKIRGVVHFASHVWVDEDDPKHHSVDAESKRQEDEQLLDAFRMGGDDEVDDDEIGDMPEVVQLKEVASRSTTDGCLTGDHSHNESSCLSEPDGHSDGNVHESHSLE